MVKDVPFVGFIAALARSSGYVENAVFFIAVDKSSVIEILFPPVPINIIPRTVQESLKGF